MSAVTYKDGVATLTKQSKLTNVLPGVEPTDVVTMQQLTSQDYGYVPYTGAVDDVNLGAYSLTATSLIGTTVRGGSSTAYGQLSVLTGVPTYSALYLNQTNQTGSNYTLASGGVSDLYINAPSASSNLIITKGNGSYFVSLLGDTTSGTTPSWNIRSSSKTGITAGSNTFQFLVDFSGTYEWATGAVSQAWGFHIGGINPTAAGASTMTNGYTQYNDIPIASGTMAITNKWGFGTNGGIHTSTNLLVGSAAITPTGKLHIGAGSATASTAPIKLTTGSVNTVAEAGAIEYNNTFHVTNSDAIRRNIMTAVNATKTIAGAPYANDGYITINIGGTDVKVMTTA